MQILAIIFSVMHNTVQLHYITQNMKGEILEVRQDLFIEKL
jgi:hypothetical protein